MDEKEFAQAAASALSHAQRLDARKRPRVPGAGDWFIVQTVGKSDQHAIDWLLRFKIESYYPQILELKSVPRRRLSLAQRNSGIEIMRPQKSPMFPRYIFARLQAGDDWGEISRFAGIRGLWCEGGVPVRMADEAIEKLKVREHGGEGVPAIQTARIVFGLGETVRVSEGPFAQFNAIVERGLDVPIGELDPETRIKVAVNIFGRLTPTELQLWQVEKL